MCVIQSLQIKMTNVFRQAYRKLARMMVQEVSSYNSDLLDDEDVNDSDSYVYNSAAFCGINDFLILAQ